MYTTGLITDLVRHLYWAHRHMWDGLRQLTPEQFVRSYHNGQRSIQEVAAHMLDVEGRWFHFLSTGEVKSFIADIKPTREALLVRWLQVEESAKIYSFSLSEPELRREIQPWFFPHNSCITVSQAMMQVFQHATAHRTQAITMMQRHGIYVEDQDYLYYLWKKQHRPNDDDMQGP